MPKQTVVRPSGIVTQPNELGELPPGTLSTGDNVMMRRQGILEPRTAFEDYAAVSGSNVAKIWPYFDQLMYLRAVSPGIFVRRANGTYDTVGAPTGGAFSPGKTQAENVRDRVFVTSTVGPVVIDPETFPTLTARRAGLPMPAFIDINTSVTAATTGVLSDQNYVSYRAVFRKRLETYTFQGAVSGAFADINASGNPVNPELTVFWDRTNAVLRAGDELELYKTEQSEDVELLGDRYRYAFSYVLTSTDISAGQVTLVDSAAGTTDDLYYDSSQEGASLNNYMPPPSSDIRTYKDATFYVAQEAWHTRTFRPKHFWGEIQDRDHDVGFIEKTVTYTNGSAAITTASSSGLTPGMVILSGDFPADTRIVTIGGSGPFTLNMSAPATAGATGVDRTFQDTIEIDGVLLDASTAGAFLADLADHNAAGTVGVVGIPDRFLVGDTRETSFTLVLPVPGTGPFAIRASHGDRYTPPLPTFAHTAEDSTDDPRTNRLFFSKIGQPEAVAPSNYLFVGKGSILRLVATQESLFALCTDGIFRIDGDGLNWEVRPVDQDTVLLSADAVDTLDNTVFAWTTAGFVSIDDSGSIQKLSAPLIGNEVRALWEQFKNLTPALPYTWGVQVSCDKFRNEVWFNFNDYTGAGHVQTWIWNTETQTFFTQSKEPALGVAYLPEMQSTVVGYPAVSNSILRKCVTDDSRMSPNDVEFNSIYADDVGLLKEWLSVDMFLENWDATGTIIPQFNAENYPFDYDIEPQTGPFEHVVAPTLNSCVDKQVRFGFALAGNLIMPRWQLRGISLRYRIASETLRN